MSWHFKGHVEEVTSQKQVCIYLKKSILGHFTAKIQVRYNYKQYCTVF